MSFFLAPAAEAPGRHFLLGGSGWDDKPTPTNVARVGHVGTADHNAFNASALAVLNVARDSMATLGLLAGYARVRGGGRRRMSDHRRLGRHRNVL